MEPDFEAESLESTGPSYVQSYVVSAFILIGILTIASNRVPATPLSILFFSVWFGAFFYWLVQNRRAERTFASDRIVVANGRVAHTFRYTITEVEHISMAVNEIKRMKIHPGEAIAIELVGEKESDFFWLPNDEQVRRLEQTLLKLNPAIQIVH
jgi:hypothetical protein